MSSFKQILLLMKIKILTIANGFIKVPPKKRPRKFFALIGGGVLFFFIYKWIFEIFATLATNSQLGSALIDNTIVVLFLGFFIFLLASGITVSIHYLFISSDLPLLMVSPVSNNTIFTFKLIEAVFANSYFFIFMGFPIFIAYGWITQAQWYYYPFMLINVVCFLAIPIAISFLGALLIVRIIPPAKAKEYMAILLGIVSLSIWLVLQVVRASTFNQNSQDFNPQTFQTLQQISHNFWFHLLPSTWAARALSGFAHSDLKSVLFNFVPLVILMICIFLICVQLSNNAFKRGFIASEQVLTLKRKSKIRTTKFSESLDFNLFFSKAATTIFFRDFKLLSRDTRQFVNILLFAVMMVFLPLLQRPEKFDSEFAIYFPYTFLLFFSALISAQISSRLIPLEKKSFWLTKLIPQSPFQLLLGKFLLGFLLSTVISWIAIIIISIYFQHPFRIVLLAFVASLALIGALSSIGLMLGIYFARFDWDHPKRMLSPTGGLLLSVFSILTVALFGFIIIIFYFIGLKLQLSQQFLDITSMCIAILLSVVLIITVNYNSAKKLSKMEWEF